MLGITCKKNPLITVNDYGLFLVVLSMKHNKNNFLLHLLPSSVCCQLMAPFQILTDITLANKTNHVG